MATSALPTSTVAFSRAKKFRSHLGQLPHFTEGETKKLRERLSFRITQLAWLQSHLGII